MDETELTQLPIKPPDKKVGESIKTEVFSFDNPPKVVKIESGPIARTFPNSSQAIAEARRREDNQQQITKLVVKQGGRSSAIPEQNSFAYADSGNQVLLGAVQEHIQNARTLKSIHGDLSKLSFQALIDLKAILGSNVELWKNQGKFFDIVGSNSEKFGKSRKLLESLNPIANANNIILDEEGNPKLIDTELTRDPSLKTSLKQKISQRLQLWAIKRTIKQIDSRLKSEKAAHSSQQSLAT